MGAEVVVRSVAGARFTQEVEANGHTLYGDEPEALGGADRGPGPYEWLLGALGTCTAITLRMYAERKGWPLEGVRMRLRHQRIHADDCEDCETKTGLLDEIQTELELRGPLDGAQRERLLEIAHRCPVHRTLTSEIKIRIASA